MHAMPPQLDLEQHPFNKSAWKAAFTQVVCTEQQVILDYAVLSMCKASC